MGIAVARRAAASSTAASRLVGKVAVTMRAFDSTLATLRAVAHSVHANDGFEPWTSLKSHLADADAALCFMTDIVDAPLLESCPELKIIACALKGYDNFDLDACAARGIAVTAVPDLLTEPTAELAVALALGLMRNVLAGDRLVRSGAFRGWRPQLYGLGLAGSTVGLLGHGAVGQATARKLRGLGVGRLLYADPRASPSPELASPASVDELLEASDVLVVCTPLTACTHHLLDRARLARAKPGLLLVNVSRGSCVDEAAVADALADGVLGGYAADVFEFEDWAVPGRPRAVEPRLLQPEARTLFTPHLGSAVAAVREEIELAAAAEIVRFARGEPLHHRVA